MFKTEASIPYTDNTRRILNSNSANNNVPDTRSNNAYSQLDRFYSSLSERKKEKDKKMS